MTQTLSMEQFLLLERIFVENGFKSKYASTQAAGVSPAMANKLEEKGFIQIVEGGDNRGDGKVEVTEEGVEFLNQFRAV